MDKVESKELLQAKALGCLDSDDDALITKSMKEDQNFPWQELGHYQNLVAFLPTLLDIENPEPVVKDNVARKLYEIGEKIKARKEKEVSQNNISEKTKVKRREEDGIILEEEPIEETEIPKVSKEPGDVKNTSSGISIKNHRVPLQDVLNDEKKPVRKPLEKKQPLRPETKKTTRQPKKDFEPVYDESYLADIYDESGFSESSEGKNRFIITVVLFAVILLALILIYFMLSSEIQENRDRIDRLEKRVGIAIIMQNTSTHKSIIT